MVTLGNRTPAPAGLHRRAPPGRAPHTHTPARTRTSELQANNIVLKAVPPSAGHAKVLTWGPQTMGVRASYIAAVTIFAVDAGGVDCTQCRDVLRRPTVRTAASEECTATTRLAGGNWPATAALHGREGERCCGRTARGRASEPHRALLRTTRIQREEELDGMSGCCDGGASFYCRHGGAGSRRCRGPNCHPLLVELHARMGRTARRCGPSQIWRRWPGSVRRRRSTSAGR